MVVNRTPSRRLAFINVVLYLAAVVGGAALGADALRAWRIWLLEPVSYQPDLLRWALPAGLVFALGVAGIGAVSRALAAERPSRVFSGATYALLGALVLWRAMSSAPPPPSPAAALTETADLLDTLREALEATARGGDRFPEDPSDSLPAAASRPSPWHAHGRRLPFRVVAENGFGARVVAHEGDSAGTIYYVVSPTGARFWMTAVVLAGAPTGSLAFLRGPSGDVLVVSSDLETARGKPRPNRRMFR